MAQEFRLPDIGEGLVEGEIVRWHIPVGGEVRVDQTVVEVETDKTVMELPSPYAGIVLHHGAAEGDVLAVGEVLVVVGQPGETWPPEQSSAQPDPALRPPAAEGRPSEATIASTGADAAPIVGTLLEAAQDLTPLGASAGATGATAPTAPATPTVSTLPKASSVVTQRPQALPKVRKLARELGVDLRTVTGSGPGGQITGEDVTARAAPAESPGNGPRLLSPLVRKLAQELGVDLATVAGSAAGGRVTRDDILWAARRGPGHPASGPAGLTSVAQTSPRAPTQGDGAPGDAIGAGRSGDDERRRLSPLRRTIAARMSRSWAAIPHVTAFEAIDAARLLAVRAALQARHDVVVPIDALVVAAVVPVLQAFPEMNASLDGDELVVHHRQHIGLAVDAPDGLLVAVVRDAGRRHLLDLSAEVRRLGERARARALGPNELTGQTFTVSNIGAVGGGYGTPLVPPDTTGILSVGRASDAPVVRDGRIEVAPMMPLSLSYDHRVIDGAVGRRFLAMLLENLAEPSLSLV